MKTLTTTIDHVEYTLRLNERTHEVDVQKDGISTYRVTQRGQGIPKYWVCNCPGARYHKVTCKHLVLLPQLLRQASNSTPFDRLVEECEEELLENLASPTKRGPKDRRYSRREGRM